MLGPSTKDDGTSVQTLKARPPGRLRLRRRLLLLSVPVLVLLLLVSIKLGSVGVLGNKLPAQFAAHDQAGMASTLDWIDVGSVGRGFKERLAAGDMAMLARDLPAALTEFKAAHEDEPSACPPRGNFALTSETLSDSELRQGNFVRTRELLEPAVRAAVDDRACFATTTTSFPIVRDFIIQTPDRLSAKLAALEAGYLTETPEGYDYLRSPAGTILPPPAGISENTCPLIGDNATMRDCIAARDAERAAKVAAAQQPGQSQQPVPVQQEPTRGGTGQTEPGTGDGDGPQFPGPVEDRDGGFCASDGTPLGDLAAALCTTSGPLP